MPNILLFDYDGVLVDSLDIFMNHFISACKKEGFPQINNKKTFLELFNNNLYESMLKKGMTLETILKIVYRVREGLITDYSNTQLFPEIQTTLITLAQKNQLYIITSNDSEVVQTVMNQNNLTIFQQILGSDHGGSKVEKIQKIKQQKQNQPIYYIGDTIGDIKEGKRANINTVAVTWGWHTQQQLQSINPTHIVTNPKEMINLFNK